MPPLRPSVVVRATRALHPSPSPSTASSTSSSSAPPLSSSSITTTTAIKPCRRSFSITTTRAGAGGQPEPRYDPPTGWLFGVKPGQKYEKEGWETPFYFLYCAPLVLMGVFMFFKPDTTIQTWALEEARRRLEKEGILEDPYPDHVESESQDINNEE